MSPAYPAHLPPDPSFHYLSTAQQAAQERYLLRATDGPVVFDPNGLIEANLVCIPGSTQLLDYSVNLLGTFQIADGAWRAEHTPWQPRQPIQPPGQLAYRSPYGWYAVAVALLHGEQIKCEEQGIGGKLVQCFVCHDPTHANYWHFVIRFADQNGISLQALKADNQLTGGGIKRIIGNLRAWMRERIGRQIQPLSVDAFSGMIPLACCQYAQPDTCPSRL